MVLLMLMMLEGPADDHDGFESGTPSSSADAHGAGGFRFVGCEAGPADAAWGDVGHGGLVC